MHNSSHNSFDQIEFNEFKLKNIVSIKRLFVTNS